MACEEKARRCCCDGSEGNQERWALNRQNLDHIHQRKQRNNAEYRAFDIKKSGVCGGAFRKNTQAAENDHRDQRDINQKHRTPVKILQQKAAQQRADRGTHRIHRHPQRHRAGTLCCVVKHGPDQRQRGRHQRGTRSALHRASRDQHFWCA